MVSCSRSVRINFGSFSGESEYERYTLAGVFAFEGEWDSNLKKRITVRNYFSLGVS